MRFSCLGTEPFSCVNYSISEHFGIPMAGSMIAINGVLLLLSLLFLRSSGMEQLQTCCFWEPLVTFEKRFSAYHRA